LARSLSEGRAVDQGARRGRGRCQRALHRSASGAAVARAASSDDVEALDALLDADADIEAPGAVIAGGTALDDAIGFGQWQAARRLVERGATTAIWHAAALGLMDRIERYFQDGRAPARYPWGGEDDVSVAFWCACHGGQRTAAEYLLDRGAELNWISPWDGLTPLDAARRSGAEDLVQWLEARGALGAEQRKQTQ
jgi:uncharacterized protein